MRKTFGALERFTNLPLNRYTIIVGGPENGSSEAQATISTP